LDVGLPVDIFEEFCNSEKRSGKAMMGDYIFPKEVTTRPTLPPLGFFSKARCLQIIEEKLEAYFAFTNLFNDSSNIYES